MTHPFHASRVALSAMDNLAVAALASTFNYGF